VRNARRIIDVPNLRAGWWTVRALREVGNGLRRGGDLRDVTVLPPPRLPADGEQVVRAVLRRRGSTCLERSLVLQRWHAAQGKQLDVVIGVTGSSAEFKAHAWLEGEEGDPTTEPFRELARVPVRGAP
jgi:Transglutaminase-like superfamily